MDTLTSQLIKGAHFLFEDQLPSSVYTPEDFTEEQKMIRQSVDQFIDQEFMPVSDRLEAGEHSLNVSLLKSLGELGFLGTHMPETYGGLGMDTNTNTIITEALGRSGAFSTTYGAHTGIGMLPILYYGNEEQGNKITKVGYGYIGNGEQGLQQPRQQQKLAGQNTIDAIGGEFEGRRFSVNVMVCDFDSPDPAAPNFFGSDQPLELEIGGSKGDSGGGAFMEINGEHQLVGIVSGALNRQIGRHGQIGK